MLIRTPNTSSTMAALAVPPATSGAAPWRTFFLQHLGQMPLPVGAISTLHPAGGDGSAAPSRAGATPRVRHCVFRGMFGTLPDNPRNPAPRNPAAYESDLPVFTTDARMAKAWEISASADLADGSSGRSSGNGGGPIEAVWWASGSGTQWRIRGTAWILGPDVDGPSGAMARAAIEKHMRATGSTDDALAGARWSWSTEVTAHFGNMSPAMRGTFRNPPPGQPRPPRGTEGNTRPGEGLGAPVEDGDLHNAAARANFRVCVIVPEEVDQVDLSDGADARRWLYRYVGEGGQTTTEGAVVNGWSTTEVWP